VSGKHARRERFEANEAACIELLNELSEWKKAMVAQSAFAKAVLNALRVMPKFGLGARIEGKLMGAWLAEEIDKQFKDIVKPPEVQVGEQEFDG